MKGLFTASDEQLMWRVQVEDDAEAFARLVRRWEEPIHRLCTRMVGDLHQAEDLRQQVFARVFIKRKLFQAHSKFSTFLWRVALNACYDELRRQRRRREISLDDLADGFSEENLLPWPGDSVAGPDAVLAEKEQAERVRAALLRLPENYRVVLILRHYENLKFREIAEVLEIPEGTVKSRMAQGLQQLQRLLGLAERPADHTSNSNPAFVL